MSFCYIKMQKLQQALNKKIGTVNSEGILNQFFKQGKKVAGRGRYTVELGKSKSGPCAHCQKMAGKHNIGNGNPPPYHPNCRCQINA